MEQPLRLVALTVDATDPHRLAAFWAGLLDRRIDGERHHGPALVPDDDTGFAIQFRRTQHPKAGQNLVHPDLTSTSLEHQQRTVARALALGGRHADVGQRGDEGHVVLADPEGNEFCVIEPGNDFLADCGFLGALACDGTRAVGRFWSEALGWPLVWDRDGETAVRSPHGGPKITWGGPPLMPRTAANRLHLDLAVVPGGDLQREVDRLVSLGATVTDARTGDGRTVLTDPDGNEFCVLPEDPVPR